VFLILPFEAIVKCIIITPLDVVWNVSPLFLTENVFGSNGTVPTYRYDAFLGCAPLFLWFSFYISVTASFYFGLT
jgi:hypothetical protein